jgi:hypothetical protein
MPGATRSYAENPTPVVGTAPTYRIYSPAQVFLVTVLCTPAAGLYLLSTNRRRMRHAGATTTLLLGAAGTALIAVGANALPDTIARMLSLVVALTIWNYAMRDEPLFDAHVGKGGKAEPAWKAAVIAVASMIVLATVLAALNVGVG